MGIWSEIWMPGGRNCLYEPDFFFFFFSRKASFPKAKRQTTTEPGTLEAEAMTFA